jgi:hypothetical protein
MSGIYDFTPYLELPILGSQICLVAKYAQDFGLLCICTMGSPLKKSVQWGNPKKNELCTMEEHARKLLELQLATPVLRDDDGSVEWSSHSNSLEKETSTFSS